MGIRSVAFSSNTCLVGRLYCACYRIEGLPVSIVASMFCRDNFNCMHALSACTYRQIRNEISKATPMFCGASYAMGRVGIKLNRTGRGVYNMAASKLQHYLSPLQGDIHQRNFNLYSKMATAKPEIHLSQFVEMMARRFQRLGIYSRWRTLYLEFKDRHLEFTASGLVDQHHNQYHRINGPPSQKKK